jgi:molecular chaperone GrpE
MKIPIFSSDESSNHERQPSPAAVPGETSESMGEAVGVPAPDQPASLKGDVLELEAALAGKTREHEATREQLLRLMADFDNYRKRMTRQQEETRQFAVADLVVTLLPGFDNLERALGAARQDVTPSNTMIIEGVGMVVRQLKEALGKVGVREVQTCGLPFDPMYHEAVDIVSVPESQDGTIVEEVQRGYLLHDRLLRPAKVIVGRAERDAAPGGA